MSAPDVIINGTLTDAAANPIAGTVVWTLVNAGASVVTANSGATIVQPQVSVAAAADGTWTVTLWRNALLSPATTYYQVELIPAGSNIASGAAAYALNTAGTFAFSGLSPQVVSGGQPYIAVAGTTGPSGTNGTNGAPGSTNIGMVDIQSYGTTPGTNANKVAGATVASGSSGTTLKTSTAAHFANGNGIVIYKNGNACAITNPPNPPASAAMVGVTGSTTFNYKIVGVDSLSGLTAASTATQITNAPALFNPSAVAISSISLTSNVVTVNFSSAINATSGQTIHLSQSTLAIGGGAAPWNGVWVVASAPTTSSVTFAFTGANASGNAVGFGRLSNAQQVTAISRSAAGVITITTQNAHGYVANTTSQNPPFVILNGVTGDPSLNGYFTIATASGTSITCNTGNFLASTGSVTLGTSTVQCYEFAYLKLPTYASGTVSYYIYSDSWNPGGALNLIGKSLPGEMNFKDWGPLFMSSYGAPAYVPTSAPSSPQNQLFGTTIASGGGTTTLTVADSIPNPTTGAQIYLDDTQNLIAAINAIGANAALGGSITISPPTSPTVPGPTYFFNYPVTIPAGFSIAFGARCYINETWTLAGNNNITSTQPGATNPIGPEFAVGPYVCLMSQIASPMFQITGDSVRMRDICIQNIGGNGIYGVNAQNAEGLSFQSCAFQASSMTVNLTNAIPCSLNSTGITNFVDVQFAGSIPLSIEAQTKAGNCPFLPYFPTLLIHWSDQTSNGCAQIAVNGNSSFSGRAICMDGKEYTGDSTSIYDFGRSGGGIEFQSPCTPSLLCWGSVFSQIYMGGWINDSVSAPMVATIMTHGVTQVTIENPTAAAGLLTCGNGIAGLETKNFLTTTGNTAYIGQTPLLSRVTGGVITTSGSTSDAITLYTAQTTSIPMYCAGNASAATDIKNGNVSISMSGNVATLVHGTTSGMIFYILATAGF